VFVAHVHTGTRDAAVRAGGYVGGYAIVIKPQ
jgi:hypothetical protein